MAANLGTDEMLTPFSFLNLNLATSVEGYRKQAVVDAVLIGATHSARGPQRAPAAHRAVRRGRHGLGGYRRQRKQIS